MSKNTLYDKVFDLHVVDKLPNGKYQLFIALHLIHEVTSPQAFAMLREKNLEVAFPERTFATIDHVVPTKNIRRPFKDKQAEIMTLELEKNMKNDSIKFFDFKSSNQGIVHIIGPELGLTRPGITIACGDSHTSTHGAFGAIAFGIGTSQVRDVLATQTIAVDKLKIRKIEINGKMNKGVYAKDVILYIIQKLGVNGGKGFVYEYSGEVVKNMSMEERMTICNMSIEGGALVGYVNPDETTFEYLKGRKFSPKEFENAIKSWNSISSGADAEYDDIVTIDVSNLKPMITWGINPGQSIMINERLPFTRDLKEKESAEEAYAHMKIKPGQEMLGMKIDIAFIGSCTNGRISDLREAASILKGRKISDKIKGLVVPGSQMVKSQAEKEGLDQTFKDAGFDWRNSGCSMCLGMNEDKLNGNEICASSSNRNFIGRQGSPKGRTVLMSPAMVAAAAIEGKIADVRKYL